MRMMSDLLSVEPGRQPFLALAFNSLMLNVSITGIFAFPGFVLPTSKILSASYCDIKRPALLRAVYKYMGVAAFRRTLMAAFWGKKRNRTKYFDGRKSGLANLAYQSRQSEFGHLGAFLVITGAAVVLLLNGHVELAGMTTRMNFVGNIYPLILQRHHRMRIDRLRAAL